MAEEEEQGHGLLELNTTEKLLDDGLNLNWGRRLPRENRIDPEFYRSQWPYFTKRVMKGSMHHTPQSVICVPAPFMREHPDTFREGNMITLEGPSGNTWRVRASEKPIMHSGWRAFAHDHDLREGDQLRFTLTHLSHFVVEVLDSTGEVKKSALNATNTGKFTVASIANPCEYVRRARKRKRSPTTITKSPRDQLVMSKTPCRRDSSLHTPTIASRCKTTARRRSFDSNDDKSTHEWMCHEEMDGREVVTILDSDDSKDVKVEEEKPNRLLDHHIGLSFGSVKVQRHGTSKIQTLVEYMKVHNQDLSVAVKPTSNHLTICEDGTNPADIGKEGQVKEAGTAKRDSCDDAMTVTKDEGDESDSHLNALNVEAGNHSDPDDEPLQAHAIPLTENAHLLVNPSLDEESPIPITNAVSSSAKMSQADHQSRTGETLLFAKLQSTIVDMPVNIADTAAIIGAGHQNRASVRRDLVIIQEQVPEKTNLNAQLDLNKSHNAECLEVIDILECHVPSSDSVPAMSMIHHNCGSNDYGDVTLGIRSQGDRETNQLQHHLRWLQPPKATVAHPRRSHMLEFRRQFPNNFVVTDSSHIMRIPSSMKSTPDHEEKLKIPQRPPVLSTDTCVLKSNRGRVANLDRERTLKAAQAWTRKLRNPHFVAVMQPSNVYHTFIMDMPGEFARKSRLPVTETKAMLICDEVPTMCRVVWEGDRLSVLGWMEFSRSHYLEEGDVCVFELHNRVAVRIGVHIFRVVGLSRSLVDWTQHYTVVHLGTLQQRSNISVSAAGSTRTDPLEVL